MVLVVSVLAFCFIFFSDLPERSVKVVGVEALEEKCNQKYL
jgi:hypothetical protein